MKVLVTGAAGFIGSHVAERLSGRAEVVGIDDLSTGHVSNLASIECELVEPRFSVGLNETIDWMRTRDH